jgi:hypothetical protein
MDARTEQIFSHPRAQSASGKQFATWLATKTKLGIPECLVALEKMPKGGVSKNHPARRTAAEQEEHEQYARPAATVPNARTPHRAAPPARPAIPQYSAEEQARQALIRADVEAANAQAQRDFAAAQNRMTPDQETWCRMNGFKTTRSAPPERTPDQKDADNRIAALARDYQSIGADKDATHSPSFGVSASADNRIYASGAEAAARLLGRDPSRMPTQSATRAPPVSRTPAPGAIDPSLYSQGEATARRLLSGGGTPSGVDATLYRAGEQKAKGLLDMSHMRREIDNELAQSFAEQTRNRR